MSSVPAALRKPRWPLALAIVFAIIGGGIAYGWETQSGYYALWPDTAHSTTQYLQVPGGRAPAPGSGFYFVDVHELQANLLEEQYFKHFVTGASLIPATEELAPGQTETQRVHVDFQMMATSQQIAQAVAERAAGMHVGLAGVSVVVAGVSAKTPAAQAGVQPGASITAVNGHKVRTVNQLEKDTGSVKPGQVVRFTFAPGGTKTFHTIPDPQQKSRGIIGIEIAQNVRVTHLPVHVKFLFNNIGGPSAGLAFTLDIYDSLTGRHLLRGHKIAVTGTISLDGTVGPIGAIQQKTIGAINAGADTFIVPAGENYRGAVAAAHGRIRVIPVTSFSQALKDIRALPPVSSSS